MEGPMVSAGTELKLGKKNTAVKDRRQLENQQHERRERGSRWEENKETLRRKRDTRVKRQSLSILGVEDDKSTARTEGRRTPTRVSKVSV